MTGQIRFKDNVSLAVSGEILYAKLVGATGLSKRILEHSRKIRIAFDVETVKAKEEEAVKDSNSNQPELANIEDVSDGCCSEAYSNEDSDQGVDSDDDSPQLDTSLKKKRAANGQGKRYLGSMNRYATKSTR